MDELLKDYEFKRIVGLDNAQDAYKLIGKYTEKYAYDYNLQRKIMNETFISYLCKHKDSNFFEKVLGSMSGYLDEEVLEYLFAQEWDMDCFVEDIFGCESCLKDLLAINIKYPKIMQLLLDKVNDSNQFYFVDGYYGLYTDLCRMNIVAGNLDKAFELFAGNNYHSLVLGKNDVEISKQFSAYKKQCNDCEVLGARQKDILFQILQELNGSTGISDVDKTNFLSKILYSEKIKLFNVANFPIIRQLYDEKSFRNFVVYLSVRESLDEVSLFSIDEDKCTLVYENLYSVLKPDNRKVLRYGLTDKK